MEATHGLCTFVVDRRLLALDVDVVAEVVTVDATIPVPMSPPFVRGLFNLRGSPILLVDLNDVLELGPSRGKKSSTALVVKRDDLIVAFPVDRMTAVLPADRGKYTDVQANEHPAVACFFTPDEAPVNGTVTVLDSEHLMGRLQTLRLRREAR
jgi:chemotaxis signal transduction protein